MNRLIKEIEELESKLEMYGAIHGRITMWGTAQDVKEAATFFKLKTHTMKKSREEEVITADYTLKRNKNIVITIRG